MNEQEYNEELRRQFNILFNEANQPDVLIRLEVDELDYMILFVALESWMKSKAAKHGGSLFKTDLALLGQLKDVAKLHGLEIDSKLLYK